jgi:NAD(P)-dependent dehydrogenase (short-subunit alcohol dehydrogenase family)
MQLNGRTILVTGGASGLGRATAEMIVAGGGTAVALDVQAAAACSGTSAAPEPEYIHTDVTDEHAVRRAIDEVLTRHGAIHGLVNVAGIPAAERVLTKEGPQALDHFTRVIHVNLTGTFNAIRLAAAAMARNDPTEAGERGVIVNTASVAAFDGQIGQAAYSASKGGIVAMTLPIAREFARFGIRMMAIAPGTFDTPLLASLPDAARESLASQVPFPTRLGRPEEFAALVRHIFENEMLNGEVIRLDGAIRMAPK